VAHIILQHHERLDGSGYPEGLVGDAILPEARILAVADVVEAICALRPYRPAIGLEKALEEARKGRGILYDTRIVDACIKLFRDGRFSFKKETEAAIYQ
jgi:HD-GYP domain-containing protein (c-di-GMP phosphodiesterase class II)